jgi:mono/diheme cytochrome c family protein
MPLAIRICSHLASLALSFVIFTGSAISQNADISRGQDSAAKNCSACHEISADTGREQNGRYVPSLREVANTPHYSVTRLRRIIAVPPHHDMPKLALTSSEITDIAAYIQSLRSKTR